MTKNNVVGTHAVLEAARKAGTIKRFLHVSTDEVYGEQSFHNNKGSGEESALTPTNPYAASKAAAEMVVHCYMQSFGLPVVITRSNNVYGPHQYPEKLVPKFMMLLSLNRPLTVHGTGQNTRSYFYVEDLAEAFDIVLHKGVTGSTYNLGTIEERSVLDVSSAICELAGADPSKSITYVQDRLCNDRRYLLNLDKATELGIKPSTSFKEGLSKTYEWFKANVFGQIYWEGLSRTLAAHPGLATLPIALGTWKLSTVDQCFNIVVAAIRAGYRHIDCAKMYNNEAEVGRAIAACIKAGDQNCELKP